jgi:hypothetical protein
LVQTLLAAKDELRAFQSLCKHPRSEMVSSKPIFRTIPLGGRFLRHYREVRQCKICKYRYVVEKKPKVK